MTDVNIERSQVVVKSNTLIRKTRYSLTTQEQKILMYAISKIKPTDDIFRLMTFDIKELCQVCGVEEQGKNYKNFKESIQRLSDKSFWIADEKKEYLMRWIEKVEINKQETTVSFKFDERLTPYLLQLKEQFTQYELIDILAFSSKYSIRIFEILKSYLFVGSLEVSLDDFKIQLEIDNEYKDFKNLRVRVIEPALTEINTYTNLSVEYDTITRGRKVVGLKFEIGEKKSILERVETAENVTKRLDKKTLIKTD